MHGMLSGKKTYVAAGLGLLTAIAGFLTGDLAPAQALHMGFEAVVAVTLRAGIAKSGGLG